MNLLLLMKRTSRVFLKICGGTDPVKELKRMSKNDRLFMVRTAVGKGPKKLLLLMSSS